MAQQYTQHELALQYPFPEYTTNAAGSPGSTVSLPATIDFENHQFGLDGPFSALSQTAQTAMGESQAFGHIQQHQNPLSCVDATMMDKFFQEDDGWNPLKASGEYRSRELAAKRPLVSYAFNYESQNLGSFRNHNNTIRSECDTVLDSGYGTLDNPSVSGDTDRNTETQSLIGPLKNFQFNQRHIPESKTLEEPRSGESYSRQGSVVGSAGKSLTCKECGDTLKTRSELTTLNDLTRHQQSVHGAKGIKYRCTEGICKNKQKDWPRSDNFRQHLKRMHQMPLISSEELEKFVYRFVFPSILGRIGAMSTWLDRDSLNGVHVHPEDLGMDPMLAMLGSSEILASSQRPLQDMECPLLEESPLDSNSCIDPDVLGLAGIRDRPYSGLRETRPHQRETDQLEANNQSTFNYQAEPDDQSTVSHRLELDNEPIFSRSDSPSGQEGDEPSFPDQSTEACQIPLEESPDANAEDADAEGESDAEEDTDSQADGPSATSTERHITLPPLRGTLNTSPYPDSPEGASLEEEVQANALLQSLLKRGVLDKMLSGYGYRKTNEVAEGVTIVDSDVNMWVACDTCGKKFYRPCELKKHLKRHEKPYACTFPQCNKSFGSKNDWKRHENSQHFQLEVWRCDVKSMDSPITVCGRVLHRRETFRMHLEKDHCIRDVRKIEEKWTTCRVGRNSESRFWCGFCQRTIEFKENGGLAWTERFDHISDHFNGKFHAKVDISQWKSIDAVPLEEPFETWPPKEANPKQPPPPPPTKKHGHDFSPASTNPRKRCAGYGADHDDFAGALRPKRQKINDGRTAQLWCCNLAARIAAV
ncbi:hypothetical protein B0H63DRAFT_454419 [Podospora didyma]|uniref:C2H2-type domain-containing protein n=1 Tax=Podospora didyma TaxID=330526 RepID=A0AAE0K5D7_9PEZI|nr:hypothetical protein B0H63DRAFT_454419 [Podospora didyma]